VFGSAIWMYEQNKFQSSLGWSEPRKVPDLIKFKLITDIVVMCRLLESVTHISGTVNSCNVGWRRKAKDAKETFFKRQFAVTNFTFTDLKLNLRLLCYLKFVWVRRGLSVRSYKCLYIHFTSHFSRWCPTCGIYDDVCNSSVGVNKQYARLGTILHTTGTGRG